MIIRFDVLYRKIHYFGYYIGEIAFYGGAGGAHMAAAAESVGDFIDVDERFRAEVHYCFAVGFFVKKYRDFDAFYRYHLVDDSEAIGWKRADLFYGFLIDLSPADEAVIDKIKGRKRFAYHDYIFHGFVLEHLARNVIGIGAVFYKIRRHFENVFVGVRRLEPYRIGHESAIKACGDFRVEFKARLFYEFEYDLSRGAVICVQQVYIAEIVVTDVMIDVDYEI